MNHEANHKKEYLSNKEFLDQIKEEDELSLQLIDESPKDRCSNCNIFVDIEKADKKTVNFTGDRLKNFPSGTITEYFCPECESILHGYTEVKENENEM